MATILIVDDRPTNRQFLTTLLGYGGHKLHEAGDGEEALRLVREHRPDLVISDILMPTMDGFEFAKNVRSDAAIRGTKIIFYTATYRAKEASLLASACGVSTVIAKPAEPQAVIDAVNAELGIASVRSVARAGPAQPAAEDEGVELSQLGVQITDYVNDLHGLKSQLDSLVERGQDLQKECERLRGISTKFAQNLAKLHITSSRLYSLIELGMDLATEKDPQALLGTFCAAGRRILNARTVVGTILRASEDLALHVVSEGLDARAAKAMEGLRLDDGLLGQVVGTRKPIVAAVAGGESALAGLPEGHPAAASFLGFSIGSSKGCYGAVFFTDKQGGVAPFDEEDGKVAEALAAIFTVIYENFELYDVLQRRAAELQLEVIERKKAEDAAREAQGRFEQIAGSISDVFYLHDLKEGKLLYVSPAYEHVWGRSAAPLYADHMAWVEGIHAEDREYVRYKIGEAAAGREFAFEYRIARPDGEVRWLQARCFPIRDAAGSFTRLAGVAKDVTDEKRRTEQLRESERRFGTMLDNVQLISMMLDRQGRITYCNDYLLRLTGWQRDEAIGKDWFELFIPAGESGLKAKFAELLADLPSAWHHENEIVTRAGERRMIRWNNTVLRSPAGTVIGAASIGEDITEQQRAEAKIRGLNRVYAVLSGINTLIVRAPEPNELLSESCRIAVEVGGFSAAWAGMVDEAAAEVKPAAWQGIDEAYALSTPRRLREEEGQFGIVGLALREREPVISNDISQDPRITLATRASKLGSQSMVSLPLVVAGAARGVLVLHAREKGFFDEAEMKLLRELAGDISFALDHLEKQKQLDYLAYYDALTGLANRSLFNERLQQHLSIGAPKAALCLIDVERFKTVNDTFGRQAGDALLKQVAERMVAAGGDPARMARMGADQFATMVMDFESAQQLARYTAGRLKQVFGPPFEVGGQEIRLSAKVGIALHPDNGADADALYASAEAALKKAKAGGESYLFFAPEMMARVAERLALESRLRGALERQQFVLHYQPKVDLGSGAIVGAEALLRWQSPERGLVAPGEFIPLLEETGLILDVGAWAMAQAAREHRAWSERGLKVPRIAVNVSAIQLRQRDFVATVKRALAEGAAAAALDLEITESVVMSDMEANIRKLRAVRELGVDVAIDDFGTGYSSLGYLAKLPVQTLKVDRSFIITMLEDPTAMTLVSTMISLAHSLRLKVIAEGVDKPEQRQMLQRLRCDEMQGYLFSKPLPAAEFAALLAAPARAAV